MGKPKYFLVKMSDSEDFAKAFRSGTLYANSLSCFRKLEAGNAVTPMRVSLPCQIRECSP